MLFNVFSKIPNTFIWDFVFLVITKLVCKFAPK